LAEKLDFAVTSMSHFFECSALPTPSGGGERPALLKMS